VPEKHPDLSVRPIEDSDARPVSSGSDGVDGAVRSDASPSGTLPAVRGPAPLAVLFARAELWTGSPDRRTQR
jgi:hypothetical protein